MGRDPRIALSQKVQNELEHRTDEALKVRHRQFRIDHANDTDEQLLEYIRKCAKKLGHSPAYGEVIGSMFIRERFGTWSQVLRRAGLPMASSVRINPKSLKIYKDEFKRQNKLRKAERETTRRQRAQQRLVQSAEQQRLAEAAKKEAREDNDSEPELSSEA